MSYIHLSGQTLPEGFVFLENEIPNLIVDLRYSKDDNFMGKKVKGYKSGQKAIGTLELANALKATVKNGKISKTDKSTGLSKYWKVVKAIEKADKK